MKDFPPESELESILLRLEHDASNGDGSDTIDAYETYLSAKKSLLDMLRVAMDGEGESSDEVAKYLNILLCETAQGYSDTLQTIEEFSDRLEFAARCMQQAVIEFRNFCEEYETEVEITVLDVASVVKGLKESLNEIDSSEEEAQLLEQMFHSMYSDFINTIVQYAQDNKQDIRQKRREILKYQALDLLKDATKIALGATAAVLVTQGLQRYKPGDK